MQFAINPSISLPVHLLSCPTLQLLDVLIVPLCICMKYSSPVWQQSIPMVHLPLQY